MREAIHCSLEKRNYIPRARVFLESWDFTDYNPSNSEANSYECVQSVQTARNIVICQEISVEKHREWSFHRVWCHGVHRPQIAYLLRLGGIRAMQLVENGSHECKAQRVGAQGHSRLTFRHVLGHIDIRNKNTEIGTQHTR